MKKDIESRGDIERMLYTFYRKAFADELIGYFFKEVVPLDLNIHIPVITDFWESILFNTHNYRKNVMAIHKQISDRSTINKQHLDRWVKLFTETIVEEFEGPKAELMKQRARSIATLMEIRFNQPNLQ
jgi:hemoglobin